MRNRPHNGNRSQPLISPPRLFEMYERGVIGRDAWLDGMRAHFLQALREIQTEMRDPQESWFERMRCSMAARRALRDCRESELREVLVALSWLDDFPPAPYLWNADQMDAPLSCFFRESRWPVLRINKVQIARLQAELVVEYGSVKKSHRQRESFLFKRDWRGQLKLESRETLR